MFHEDKCNEGAEEKTVSRRTALGRGVGVAAIGVTSALATAVSAPAAAAVPGRARWADAGSGGSLPRSVAGIRIPGGEVARRATAFAREASSETLFNHVMRTYLFSCVLFDQRGVHYDRELAFLAAVLHDLGLVEAYRTPAERFELDGADAAQRFLERQRVPEDRVAVVWDAIALHTNVAIAARKRPEIAMVSVGSGADFSGNGIDRIPAGTLEEILAAFPRAGFKQDAVDTMLSLCRTKPMSVLMHPFAEVGRRHIPGFAVPTVEDLVLAAPFAE
ncbi:MULTISPECIES: HD domain-containing protein [unclassified Streptomyces]|uniref:HD domain-containing protein n=1 Tax=unclassified Streptomyces TaxID=2593676 RepID=UPI00068F0544|nr:MULTISPECIES: HD domain-containing protein [unclassified Streptomyces]